MTRKFKRGPMGRVPITIYHSRFTRLRTYPQHTLSLLPLLRSRPGGVHKTSVVRSTKSDKQLKHCRLPNANCRLVFRFFELSNLKDFFLTRTPTLSGDQNIANRLYRRL